MEDSTIVAIVSIIGVVILETVALFKGINGTYLAGAIAVISGLGGYIVKGLRDKIV